MITVLRSIQRLTSTHPMPINVLMMTTLRIQGEIGRPEPDPSTPHDSRSQLLGFVSIRWQESGVAVERSAAVLQALTGRGPGDPLWGEHVLLLRWIGDPPPVQIAQSVYDVIRDGGRAPRSLIGAWDSMPASEAQGSYRTVRS